MTDKQQHEALCIADALEMPMADFPTPTVLEARAATKLRRQHAELETLNLYKNMADEYGLSIFPDIAEMTAELETLRSGYAAARLEIESLLAERQRQISVKLNYSVLYVYASQHGIDYNSLCVAVQEALAQPAGAQQPGAAYAAPQFPAHPEPMVMDWSAIEISVIAQYGRDMYEAGKRASHGQAPAQAAPITQPAPQQEAQECGNCFEGKSDMDHECSRCDGAGVAKTDSQPSPAAQGDALDAAFEAVRLLLCGLERYSFVLDDDGVVRRVRDRVGNWIEFDAAHELFDPAAVDAARAAQEGKSHGH